MSLARKHTGFSFLVNLGGRIWFAIFSIIFIPKFAGLLGPEAYGLVGLQTMIMSVAMLLDLGLSNGITHRLAGVDLSRENDVRRARNLLRSFEAFYLVASLSLSLIISFGAPWIAKSWLQLQAMSLEEAQHGLRIMAIYALFQFPQSLYTGALIGLYKPERLNLLRVGQITVQNVGAYLLLRFYAPTIYVYLFWHAAVAILTFLCMRLMTWKELPLKQRAHFDWPLLRENLAYFKDLTKLSFWGIIVGMADRIISSRFLPLPQVGVYLFSSQLANALQNLGQPFQSSISPKLSRLYQEKEKEAAGRFYLRAAAMLSTLIIPAGIAVALFARDVVIVAGTHADFLEQAPRLLSVLAIGTMLNVIMLPPLALQMSHEWTKLSTYKNVIAAAIYLPMMYFAIKAFGAIGAAYSWVALNGSYVLFEVPLMHRRLLPGKLWTWYKSCLIVPTIVSVLVLVPLKYLIDAQELDRLPLALALCVAGGISLVAVGLSQAENRSILRENMGKVFPRLGKGSN